MPHHIKEREPASGPLSRCRGTGPPESQRPVEAVGRIRGPLPHPQGKLGIARIPAGEHRADHQGPPDSPAAELRIDEQVDDEGAFESFVPDGMLHRQHGPCGPATGLGHETGPGTENTIVALEGSGDLRNGLGVSPGPDPRGIADQVEPGQRFEIVGSDDPRQRFGEGTGR